MKKYYYSDGKQQNGPLSKEELQNKDITKDTLVWYEGLTEWTKAGDAEELADLFPNTPTPPPIPEQKIATPPPIPENKTITPPPMPKQNDGTGRTIEIPKKKTRKKLLIILGCILLVTVSVYAVDQIIHHKKMDTYYLELENAKRYLTIKDAQLKDNILSGRIISHAKYYDYKVVQISLSYYDDKGNVIQGELCNINGPFHAGSSTPFKIRVKRPNFWNYLSVDSFDIEITSESY